MITIFQLITSTSVSIFSLEDRLLAKEVANNRMALINTLEKPINKQPRKGDDHGWKNMDMGRRI